MPEPMTDGDRVLAELRPTMPVDPAWAEVELQRITSLPAKRGRRTRWAATGAAAAAVIAFGGATYAGGLVPSVVTQRLGDGDQRYPISRIGDVRRVFELTTRTGVHVELFLAPNDAGGECWAVTHDLSADTDPEELGYACVASPPGTPERDDGVSVVPTDSDHPGPPILFGLDLGGFELPAGTRRVHVHGPGLDETVRTRTAEGWAVELPDNTRRATYRVEFLGRDGEVLDQVTREVD